MSRLDLYLPSPRLREVDSVAVAASPADTYAAFRHFDASRIRWIDALFWLREVPDRLRGRVRGEHVPIGLDAIVKGAGGFLLLEDRPEEEVVVGAVGKFWRPNMEMAKVTRDTFAAFDEPGWGKLAWSLRAEPSSDAGSLMIFELRVTATDDASWRRFTRYFSLIGPFSRAIRRSLLKNLSQELGARRMFSLQERDFRATGAGPPTGTEGRAPPPPP